MAFARVPLIAGACLVAQALVPAPPKEYFSWTAEKKVSWIKSNMDIGRGGSADVGPQGPYPRDPGPQDIKPCMNGECVHPGGRAAHADIVGPYECKMWNLHPVGPVAWVKAVWYPTLYSGMFQKADVGLARWSFQATSKKMIEMMDAAQQHFEGRLDTENCPGDCWNVTQPPKYAREELEEGEAPDNDQFMAIKFFRDGVPSASVHLTGLGGTSWNLLDQWYSNLVQTFEEPNVTQRGALSEQGAQRGTAWPGFTGLHDMAMYNQEGELQHLINFPYQIHLTPALETVIPRRIPHTVVGHWPRMKEILNEHLKPGTAIFDIYAKHSLELPMMMIGRLELASEFMLSEDCDRQLYFPHPRYDRDVVLRPDIVQGRNCPKFWGCPICPENFDLCYPDEEALKRFDDWLAGKGPQNLDPRLPSNSEKSTKSAPHLPNFTFPAPRAGARRRHGVCAAAQQEGRPQPPAPAGPLAALWSPDEAPLIQQASLRSSRTRGLRLHGVEPMRVDDWDYVEPRSTLLHTGDFLCQAESGWPSAGPRHGHNCSVSKVPERGHAEPEWKIEGSCPKLPECSHWHGAWYSSDYPCVCGSSTCRTGQICNSAKNSCTSWGPYAL